MSDEPVCPRCENRGWKTWCPICKRTSSPRLQFTQEMLDQIHEKHTAPRDHLDGFLDGLSGMDSRELNRHADEMRKDGVSDSFLALCIRLVWGPWGFWLLVGTTAAYLVLNRGVS